MRLFCLALFGLMLTTSFASAQNSPYVIPFQTQPAATPAPVAQALPPKPIFGSYTCQEKIPCPEDSSVMSDQWAAYGNSCVSKAFNYTAINGVIDDMAGLDEQNCLTANPGTSDDGTKSRYIPKCCVVKMSNGCAMHCDITTQ